MGYAVVAVRRNRMHKLATIGSKIALYMTSTNVREELQMGSSLNSLRIGLSESKRSRTLAAQIATTVFQRP